jgi:hypothetical protein
MQQHGGSRQGMSQEVLQCWGCLAAAGTCRTEGAGQDNHRVPVARKRSESCAGRLAACCTMGACRTDAAACSDQGQQAIFMRWFSAALCSGVSGGSGCLQDRCGSLRTGATYADRCGSMRRTRVAGISHDVLQCCSVLWKT